MKNLVFNLRTAKAQAEGCAKVSRMAKVLTTLTLLLTLGVGQMWADDGDFYNMYIAYSFEGAGGAINGNDNNTGVTVDAGTLTSGSLTLTGVYLKCWDDWGKSYKSSGGQLCYTNKGGSTQYISCTRSGKSGNNYEYQNSNPNVTLASYDQASGSFEFHCWGQTWGWGDRYFPKSSGHYVLKYKIAPPAVSGFGVTTSGYLAGSGTEGDPYLVTSGSALTLTASGGQAHTDANSSINYKFGDDAYSTTATKNITVTSSGSIAVKARCKNTSASLDGAETETITIYYAPVSVKDISVYIYVGGCTPAQINSVEMNGCKPYVGTTQLTAIDIKGYNSGSTNKFTKNGDWLEYTFSNVTKVSDITCARSGGNIFTGEITDNIYYKFDGAKLDGKCVSAPNLTWTTAPVNAKVGVHMTAVVNTTPVSGGSPSVTWSTSNSNIAAVNKSTGEISYKAAGSATITAHVTWSATGDYCAGSYDLEQTITVSAPSQEAELGSITLDPSGQQNYGELPIDFELKVTSTYLPNPVVVFLVNDGETTYEVVGAPYGDEGNSPAGTIGTGPAYTTVHKATFTASEAKSYTVSAKLYEGELIDNFEGENTRGWAGDNLGNGSMTFANNPVKMTVNGSNKVMQVTRTGGKDWGGAIMLFVADTREAKTTCDAAGSNDYAYIHARMKDATDATHLKNNDAAGNSDDINPIFVGANSSDWRHVTYRNTHCSNNFLFFMIQRDNTGDKTVYIDDIILSNEASMTVKASEAAPASFSINTVTLNNNGATTPGTESVIVTYGSALSNITVPSKTDYTFYGYYTENAGEGRQLINDAGEWIASVDGYTNENKKWVHDGNVTLYAYYKKAQITRITFSPGNIVAPSATVTVTATIEPAPAGETTICWRVLYSNDNPLAPQPKFTPAETQGKSVSFKAPEASGSYKVEATLRKGAGCDGEEIHTFTAPFQVAGDHTVTVQYKCGNTTIKASTSATGKPLEWTAITAPDIVGYSFLKWVEGDGITIEGATNGEKADATINFKAIYDGQLTAIYTQKQMIYFNNTLGWKDVWVYFYNDASGNRYWANNYGTGANKQQSFGNNKPYWEQEHGHMTQIKGTDIWYFDFKAAGYNTTRTKVAFVNKDQSIDKSDATNDEAYFHNASVIYREDFDATNLPMFVPIDAVEYDYTANTGSKYYRGYWMNYPENTGYTLRIYSSSDALEPTRTIRFPFGNDKKMPLKLDVEFNEAATNYYYTIYREDGTVLSANYGMNTNYHSNVRLNNPSQKISIKTTAPGIYTFTLVYKNTPYLDYYISVDYPIVKNDYRISYSDNATWSKGSAHTTGWYHPSDVIRKNTDAEVTQYDTVSFYIAKGDGITASMKFQYASEIVEAGTITWKDVDEGAITIPSNVVTKPGVYNFIIKQVGTANPTIEKVEPYTGNYYIRTDNAGTTKWDYYRAADHQMTYSEYSITHGGYSHYYCHWVPIANAARKNIKFCIANDYSPCISDTLARETASGEWTNINSFIDEHGNLQRSSNVRFMWNQSTNKVSRAYLDPSTNDDNFLVLESADGRIANQNEIVQPSVVFSDNENWIYEANVKAKPNAQIKLKATWGDAPTIVQYFKGTESTTETLITGSTNNWYDIRLIYDFKTNRLIAAMLPSGNHTTIEPINADVMFIREHQGDIEQLTFTGNGALTNIKTAYGVMRFNKWTLNNKDKDTHNPLAPPASIYERAMYFISFPFEVKLSEVFGFGIYGQDWIIEYYDGAERARTGWWEGQPGFWRYVWDRKNFVLKPNVGYLLELELGNFKEGSGFWNNNNERLELFFPSSGNLGSITNTTVNCSIPEHACYINRHETEGLPDTPDNPRTSYNRTIFDSHWNVMGVPTYVNVNNPSFANTTWIADGSRPKFLYTWNPVDNTLTATSGKSFMYHAMHAYIVQYGGNVQWVTSGTKPAAIVARNTYAEEPKEVEFRLEIQQNEKMVDQTFVIMSNDDQINANFQFGEDMSKDFNARNANIYTMTADNVAAAGNSLPMSENTTIVPVGVSVKKTGDYTFSIPDGTNGVGITLIDEETGIRTSLSALSYTVNLAVGDYTERFWLEISPIQNTPTGLEEPTSDSSLKGRAQKRIIDGVLYIVKDGKIFDARGTRVE